MTASACVNTWDLPLWLCYLQPLMLTCRHFPVWPFGFLGSLRCLPSCLVQLNPPSFHCPPYIMKVEFLLRFINLTSWVWTKSSQGWKKWKLQLESQWNDAVSALQGLLLFAPINSLFIVGELFTRGCIERDNSVSAWGSCMFQHICSRNLLNLLWLWLHLAEPCNLVLWVFWGQD